VVTLPSYASTYPDEAARRVAVELAQNNAATALLYGCLPDPGSPGQLFVWEIGTFVTLLVAVLGVLMTVRLTRSAEQEGTIEIVRSAGLGPLAPLMATFVVLAVVGAILGLVSAAGVGLRAGQVDGVDWTGSLAFGSVVALTFLLMALITVILAQLLPTPWSARVAGALALAGSFALRAAADTQHHPWLHRITPLGLRASVEPFTSNSPVPLVVSSVVVILLAVVATALERSRELGGASCGSPRPGSAASGCRLPSGWPGAWAEPRPSGGSRGCPWWGTVHGDGVERGGNRPSGPTIGWVPGGTARRRRPRLGLLRIHRHGRCHRRRGVRHPLHAGGGHGGTSRTR
jgi:putative exporter of polyketide antibiotics